MSTRNELLNGADYEGFEGFCDTLVNHMKNNWRQSDPQSALTDAQPGMVASDADDDKLYHKLGAGGPVSGACQPSGTPAWDEVLQARMSCDVEPEFASVELGDNHIRTNSRFLAYANNEQTINTATLTTVQCDTEEFDSGGNYNTGTYTFTFPVSGFWHIFGNILYKGSVDSSLHYCDLLVNAVVVARDQRQSASTSRLTAGISKVVYAQAGWSYIMQAYQDTGGNIDIDNGAQNTYFGAHLQSI